MAITLETVVSLEQGIALGRINPLGLRVHALTSIARHLTAQPEREDVLVTRSLLMRYVDLVSDGGENGDREAIDRLGGLIRIKLRGV